MGGLTGESVMSQFVSEDARLQNIKEKIKK